MLPLLVLIIEVQTSPKITSSLLTIFRKSLFGDARCGKRVVRGGVWGPQKIDTSKALVN